MLHLHERFHPHDNRPLVIGALGNSITFGISTNASWLHSVEVALNSLSVLDSTTKALRVHTVNGAVQASSADFAALCYDEIWRLRGIEPVPELDVAVIDYSFTSSVSQMGPSWWTGSDRSRAHRSCWCYCTARIRSGTRRHSRIRPGTWIAATWPPRARCRWRCPPIPHLGEGSARTT